MPHVTAIGLSLAILVSLESTLAATSVDRLFPKLRPRDAWVTSLIAEGSQRSATFRRLADRLATLKVIIYIGHAWICGIPWTGPRAVSYSDFTNSMSAFRASSVSVLKPSRAPAPSPP